MIKFFKAIQQRHHEDRESGVAMVLAILITLVLVSLVASMTAFAMMGLDKGKDIQDVTAASNAADSALSHAMSLANSKQGQNGNGLEKHIGVNNAVYGSVEANEIDPINGDGQYLWRWYAEQIVDTKANIAYDIYATGYQKTPNEPTARNFKVRVEATVVESAKYLPGGGVYYTPTMAGMFNWGVFGTSSVIMKDTATVKTYDAAKNMGYPIVSTRKGKVASNGVMTLGTTLNLEEIMFLSTPSTIDPARCTGTGCTAQPLSRLSYGMDLSIADNTVKNSCPLNSTSYPDWKASVNAATGVINDTATPMCYNNIIFDRDVSVSLAYSTGRPAVMLAKGNITVEPGVEVNRQTSTSQGPLALRIYSQFGTDFLMKRGTTANPTKLTGVVSGSSLNCNIGQNLTTPNPHGTALYGAMACKTAIVESGSEVWWDDQLEQVSHEGSPTSSKLWQIDSYQEL